MDIKDEYLGTTFETNFLPAVNLIIKLSTLSKLSSKNYQEISGDIEKQKQETSNKHIM